MSFNNREIKAIGLSEAARVFGLSSFHRGKDYYCPSCGKDGLRVKDDRYYSCYRCQQRGGVLELLIHSGVASSVLQAKQIISKRFNIKGLESYREVRQRLNTLGLAFSLYQQEYESSDEVKDYCLARGWQRQIDAGFAPEPEFLQRKGLSLAELVEAGLAMESGWELMTGRLVLGVKDKGRIVHMTGRALDSNDELRWVSTKGMPPISSYLYKNSSDDAGASDYPDTLYLTEGGSDTYSLFQLGGLRNVGTFGINIKASLLINYLQSEEGRGIKRIYALYDNDRYSIDGSDKSGVHKSWSVVLDTLIEVSCQLEIPIWCFMGNSREMDINDQLIEINYDREGFVRLIREGSITLSQLAYQYYSGIEEKTYLIWRSLVSGYVGQDEEIRSRLMSDASKVARAFKFAQ